MAVGLFGWFPSMVISKLINELIEDAHDQKKMQLGLKDELKRLQKALPMILVVGNAIDQGLIREENPELEKWLWQLRDATDQADDVMDEIKYIYEKERVEAQNNKVNNCITDFRTFFLFAIKKDPFLVRLEEAVKAIDEVAANVGKFYKLVKDVVKDQKETVKLAISSCETNSVLNVGIHLFGREKEQEDIIQKLLNPSCKTKGKNFALLPIIGVGGVGKTALVQLVYNDSIVQKHFELKMWVCISNNFDVELLTKKLYESAFQKRADFDNFSAIQTKLKEKLQSKRFLVVFDDVWNDNNKKGWDKLIAPLKYGKSGSMILLTTRMKTIATLTGPNLMDSIILEGLNACDMWDLFKECAFRGEDPQKHQELMEIGRGIMKKLKGSPLAAKTVGGILWSNLNAEHWRSILESELWSLEQGQNDIMPALRLTYLYLPPYLKPCFSFCSIFPKDHVFNKSDLINMWIALGMVPQGITGTMRPEDVGSRYFDYMLNKSIFICPNHEFRTENEFVMPYLIHDLCILVSQGECLRTSTNKSMFIPNTVRHLYVIIQGPCEVSISSLKNLRTLILHFRGSHHHKHDLLVTEMLKGMKSLRLLVLFAHNLSEFPQSASKLLHLRYLCVGSSRISAIPKSLSTLYLLETMVYNDFGTRQLKQADALGMLINLRHLNAPEWLLDRISHIERLTSLQELSFSASKDCGFKIWELSDMRELRHLRINRIENIDSHEEVIQANLKDKVHLNELSLTWTPNKTNKHANEDVLDHLEPHSGLKKLSIKFYKDVGRPPIWFRTQVLSKLVCLTIHDCNFVHLPCLEELPCLKYIDLCDMDAIETIIHSAVDAFPSLEQFTFNGMRAIEEWSLAKQPNKWMQCLRKLDVFDCPKLQVLPPIPIGVKELNLKNLGLSALPNPWNEQSNKIGSLLDLVVMSISDCENLVSLTEGLLQNPEQFVALEELNIKYCEELKNLPPGGFNRFSSLKKLDLCYCPKIDRPLVQECFLPSSLQKLSISSCGLLEISLPKALESVHSLNELELYDCANITSLPPKEVFSRWKTLKRLTLEVCTALVSLESLLGLSYIEYLKVCGCPQLSPAIPSSPPLKENETERKEEVTMQTSYQNDEFNKWFMNLKKSILAQSQPPSPSSTMEIGQTFAKEKPISSVDDLVIDDPFLLFVEPIKSLSTVKKLSILDCSKLQLLPEIPPFLKEICIKSSWPVLQRIIEGDNAGYLKDMAKHAIDSYETNLVSNVGTHVFGWEKEEGIIKKSLNPYYKNEGKNFVIFLIISKLINELIEYAKDHKKMQLSLKDELTQVDEALPKIQVVVNAIDQGLIREENPKLEKWLWQLRDAADQADDVMDLIKYNYEKEKVEVEKNKVNKAITNFRTFFLRSVTEDPFLKQLKEALKVINDVVVDVREFYMLVPDLLYQKKMVKSVINSSETNLALNVRTHVFGREKEKEETIMKLLNPDCKIEEENFTILPIIGAGGVGKTTFAQLVYNDPTVKKHFELRMWVCISNNFDVELLTKKLYESVFQERVDFNTFDLIQDNLKKKLESKRFLVVFDDVWNDINKEGWDKLVDPLTYGKSGSIMLLTTRMKSVSTMIGPNLMDSINLEGLNECDMWDIFKECAFGDEFQKRKELLEIGGDIVKKLKGSPLAAKTVGGILCSDRNEVRWKSILQSELWNLGQGHNDIMPALRLTYNYLPPHLKPCFSFCSIFPQDHIFSKNDLINMWIALGMVPQSVNGTISPEHVGSKYFDDMLSKSIFIRPNHVLHSENEFVMHDLIHDLSILVSQGECLRTSTYKPAFVPNTIRHLYAHIDGPGDLNISGLKNLRTLILHFDESHHFNQDSLVTEMLKGLENLRLLILFANNLREFPENVSNLLHLRYLSITSTRISTFPKSVSKLFLLETMDLLETTDYNDFGTSQQKEAESLDTLFNLRHLIAPDLIDKIASIGRLTSLQELSFCVGKDSGFKICELSDMRELRNLIIERIENVGSREEVILANLRNKVHLNKLSLIWSPTKPNKLANEDVLDHLQPHSGLKELTIRSYKGTGRPPLWFTTQALSRLVCLTIDGCNFDHLPCLEELPHLKHIHFLDMNAKGIIHQCNMSSTTDVFPSLMQEYFLPLVLQKLTISSCGLFDTTLLKALESVNSLTELELSDCANITSLPSKVVFSRWKTLKILILEDCTALASLENLIGLSSIEYLKVCGCPELSLAIPSPLPLKVKRKDDGTTEKSNRNDELNKCLFASSRRALAFFRSLVCTFFILVLGMFLQKLKKYVLAQTQLASPRNLMETGQTYTQKKHLLSVDELVIDDPLLLSVEPIRSLSAVRKLSILDCSKLHSLPKLPPFLQELYIRHGNPELRKRCEINSVGYQLIMESDLDLLPYDF